MTVLDERLRAPRHKGVLAGPSGSGQTGNPACGDILVIHVCVRAGVVDQASFECLGSPYQQAVASILCDLVVGRSVADARAISAAALLAAVPDLPARHRHLCRLAVDALGEALATSR